MKGVFEIAEAVISLLGRDLLCFDSRALPCSLAAEINQSSLTQTHTPDRRAGENLVFPSDRCTAKPCALCAEMHAKMGDICLGVFKQWRTFHRSNISNGDIFDMHEELYRKSQRSNSNGPEF